MNPAELFGILHNIFGKANPKVIVKTSFTKKQEKLLSLLIVKYKRTSSPYDSALLAKTYLRILSNRDKVAFQRALLMSAKSNLIPPGIRSNLLKTKDELSFRTLSPAGPARFARVPFYPIRNEDAWSSRFLNIDTATPSRQAFGIDELGDDPILAVGPWLSTSNVTKAGPYTLMTQKVEFGAYRLIGLEISAHYGSRYIGAVTAGGVAATGAVSFDGPTAVAATATFTVAIDTLVGININVRNSLGLNQTVTSVAGAPGVNEFQVDPPNPNTTAANLAALLNGFAGISATSEDASVKVEQSEFGTVENGQLATSDTPGAQGISNPGTFTGGTDNVTANSTITLIDADGTTQAFTAVAGVAGANQFTIDQVIPAQTANNFRDAVNLSAIDITVATVGINAGLTQDGVGATGNTAIATSFPVGGVTGYSVTNFTGGTNTLSLNLNNSLSPISLSIRELTVYNGNNILVVEDSESVSIMSFNVLNRPETFQYTYEYPTGTSITPTGQAAAPLTKSKREAGYKFIGLRDQPIVDSNSQVFVRVEGFIPNIPTYIGGYPADTPLPKIPPISLSMNLIVDLLEDKIFGDPIVPSPASRPAANIKLGKRPVGYNKIKITNTTFNK